MKKIGKLNINKHKAMRSLDRICQNNKFYLLRSIQETHVNWNFLIIYGYHFLINHIQLW